MPKPESKKVGTKKRLKVFTKFLTIYPLSHALVRGMESLLFSPLPLKPPVLDLGCGDGSFALLTFGKKKIDTGLDQSPKQIAAAQITGTYKKAIVGQATALPFPDASFNTVISNSVLEHLRNPNQALDEIFRILSPRGLLIFTVPGKNTAAHRFWFKLFGNFYLKIIDKFMHHHSLNQQNTWLKRLRQAGFSKIKVTSYAPKKTVTLLDFFVPFSLFYYLTGRPLGPQKLLARLFLPFFYLDKKRGLGYFFQARKP